MSYIPGTPLFKSFKFDFSTVKAVGTFQTGIDFPQNSFVICKSVRANVAFANPGGATLIVGGGTLPTVLISDLANAMAFKAAPFYFPNYFLDVKTWIPDSGVFFTGNAPTPIVMVVALAVGITGVALIDFEYYLLQ